mmetsp:Transcript_37445/g.64326  ORF Transcript_37445/g.64326 Transcript_37445/m.64326 type:complete len:189 (+) Transcript_37445:53-619(+)
MIKSTFLVLVLLIATSIAQMNMMDGASMNNMMGDGNMMMSDDSMNNMMGDGMGSMMGDDSMKDNDCDDMMDGNMMNGEDSSMNNMNGNMMNHQHNSQTSLDNPNGLEIVNTIQELSSYLSYDYETTENDGESVLIYIPILPIFIAFILGVLCTLCCVSCCTKRKKINNKPKHLTYEQVYPVEQFAQFV